MWNAHFTLPPHPSPHHFQPYSCFTTIYPSDISMQLQVLFACLITGLHSAKTVRKTPIYIDQVPIYTKLASCAQERVSVIVRDQSSGCGDDSQLTSFVCFCLDSSTQFASIISTAVKDQCSRAAVDAALTAILAPVETSVHHVKARVLATPAPTSVVAEDVKSALEVFDRYCSKSTELTKCECT
jgi:hypothetical protein